MGFGARFRERCVANTALAAPVANSPTVTDTDTQPVSILNLSALAMPGPVLEDNHAMNRCRRIWGQRRTSAISLPMNPTALERQLFNELRASNMRGKKALS